MILIRKVVAYVASFVCFWLGDAAARVMNMCEWTGRIYPIYNRLILWSSDVNDWGGINYWPPKINAGDR